MDITKQRADAPAAVGLDPETAGRAAQTTFEFLQERGPSIAQQFLGGQCGYSTVSFTDLFKR